MAARESRANSVESVAAVRMVDPPQARRAPAADRSLHDIPFPAPCIDPRPACVRALVGRADPLWRSELGDQRLKACSVTIRSGAWSVSTLLRRPVAAILVEDEARYRSTRVANKGDLCVHVLGEEVVVALGPELHRGAACARPDMERPVLQRDGELQAWRELVDADVE